MREVRSLGRRITAQLQKIFRPHRCKNCFYYRMHMCTWPRTAHEVHSTNVCGHWVDKNFYMIYREYLKDVLVIADRFEDDEEVIRRLDMIKAIYGIEDFKFCTMQPSVGAFKFRRIWFKFKEDVREGHFMHFTKDFYELDCNVTLETNRTWRRL